VKNDPERYAAWKEQEAKHDEYADSDTIIEVRGCGHEQIYACSYKICKERSYPRGAARW
jgi:hypothetical protein